MEHGTRNMEHEMKNARLRFAKAKLRRAKVELEGLEPSSKQIAEVLSTCLAGYWLSDKARKSAPKPCLISLISPRPPERRHSQPEIASALWSGWNQASPPAERPVPKPCPGIKPLSPR